MPTTKEYNAKLNRLRSTRKITNTMKLVSVNKLRKAQAALRFSHAFSRELRTAAEGINWNVRGYAGPLSEVREKARRVLLLVANSDRGLCGGFNNNLNRYISRWLESQNRNAAEVEVSFYGRRGYNFFRNRVKVACYYAGQSMKPVYTDIMRVSGDLQRHFVNRRYDEVWVGYNQLQETGVSRPVVEKFLPAARLAEGSAGSAADEPILEPCRAAVAEKLMAQVTHLRLYDMLLQSAAGEQSARMIAMDNATRNVDNLVDTYTLFRNRARQAAVTRELMEILGGAEALNG